MTTTIQNTNKARKPNGFVAFFKKIGDSFVNFGKRFADGSVGTKISHFICGAGNFYHHQYIKGLIYLFLQVAFVLFMVLCPEINGTPYGWKALANLVLQGNEGGEFDPSTGQYSVASDSKLMLLFGLLTIAVIILFIILWLSNIASSYKADQSIKEGKHPTTFIEDCKNLLDSRFHVLMLTPTCVFALIFTLMPTIFMILMAFTTYNLFDMNAQGTSLFHWNGFSNFSYMFTGQTQLGKEIKARFFPVFGWTIIWAIFATFTCYFGGILLALLINKKGLRGKKIYRTIFVLTIALPQFISLLSVRNLLGEYGPINSLLQNLGWIDAPIGFLGLGPADNEIVAKTTIIIVNMWLGIPYTMLMTSGILMNIPHDLYEAGKVDGAGNAKMFFKITLPYVFFITTPYLISSFVGNINSFNTIYLLSGGGPTHTGYSAGGTDLLVTWLYKLTIENGEYNTGAVIGILTFIITATITLITYRRSKAFKEEDTFQ